jgi:hypothetical protein
LLLRRPRRRATSVAFRKIKSSLNTTEIRGRLVWVSSWVGGSNTSSFVHGRVGDRDRWLPPSSGRAPRGWADRCKVAAIFWTRSTLDCLKRTPGRCLPTCGLDFSPMSLYGLRRTYHLWCEQGSSRSCSCGIECVDVFVAAVALDTRHLIFSLLTRIPLSASSL